MILLCSNGLTSQVLLKEAGKFCSPGAKAALVVTADPVYKEKNYHVARSVQQLEYLGCQVDIFDFDTMPAETLLSYQVVEMIGGNPYYLLASIRAHSGESVLRKIAEKSLPQPVVDKRTGSFLARNRSIW